MAAALSAADALGEEEGSPDAFHIRLLESGDIVKIYDVDSDTG